MPLPTATRIILQPLAVGASTSRFDANNDQSRFHHLLEQSLSSLPVSLGQRIDLQGEFLSEVVDILPTSVARFDPDETNVVILKHGCSRPLLKEKRSEDEGRCLSSFESLITIDLMTQQNSVVSPDCTLLVSSTIRALLDTISRDEWMLFCGVPVAIKVDCDRDRLETLYAMGVESHALLMALANASRYHPHRVGGNRLSITSLDFGDKRESTGLVEMDVLQTLFDVVPSQQKENVVVAVKIAPLLPFSFRNAFLSEDAMWKGLRQFASVVARSTGCPDKNNTETNNNMIVGGMPGSWVYEGQLIHVPFSPTKHSASSNMERYVEGLLDTATSSQRDTDIFKCKYQSPEDQSTCFEIVSVVTHGGMESGVASEGGTAMGGYFTCHTKVELCDVSDTDGIIRVSMRDSGSSKQPSLSEVGGAERLLDAIQQCIDFQSNHEEAFEDDLNISDGVDPMMSVPSPPLQTIILHGEEANMPFETAYHLISRRVGLPFTVHDCRCANDKASSNLFDFGIGKLIAEGCQYIKTMETGVAEVIAIRRPMLLVIRHAELLEEKPSALLAVAKALERNRGYLVIVMCHERSVGGGDASATNSANASSPSAVGAASRLSSALTQTLVATIYCGVPTEEDRVVILKNLFPPSDITKMAEDGWIASMTLSPSLVASWAVGFTVMDIIAFVGTVVRKHAARYCGFSESFRLVLSDSEFQEGLIDYQGSHGLVVSSTRLQPVKWSDVGGLHEAKKELLETIQLPTKYPHLFKAGGMQRKMGILLFGPPGCGKTLLAKAVATEMSMNFLSIKGPELINQYVGESEKNVRDIFQRARDNAPCVLFFDELDALAPARGAKGDAGGAMDRIVSQLLVEMDGVDAGGGDVFIVAATNRPDMLDAALLRPGRFDQRCYLGPPDGIEEKTLALKALTRKFSLAEDVDLTSIATRLQSMGRFTGADMFALCSDAMLFAVEERVAVLKAAAERAIAEGNESFEGEDDDMKVRGDHFQRALEQLKPSVTAEEFEKYEKLRTNMDK